MSGNTVLVMGDRFSRQFTYGKTMSISDILRRLRADSVPAGLTVAVGQGLSAAQLKELGTFVDSGQCALAPNGRPFPVHAELGLTHKQEPANVMISAPAREGNHQFVVDLLIDEQCEVMSDHLTGRHIPALALMEAARQTWTAVTESYFPESSAFAGRNIPDGTRRTRFVIGAVESEFHHYVFPFAATLRYELLSHDTTAVGRVFRCHITVSQGGLRAADIRGSYRVIPAEVGEKHELLASRRVAATEIERLTRPTTTCSVGHPAGDRILEKEDSR